jgi:hypothetical protein
MWRTISFKRTCALKLEVADSSKILVPIYQTTRLRIPKDLPYFIFLHHICNEMKEHVMGEHVACMEEARNEKF